LIFSAAPPVDRVNDLLAEAQKLRAILAASYATSRRTAASRPDQEINPAQKIDKIDRSADRQITR